MSKSTKVMKEKKKVPDFIPKQQNFIVPVYSALQILGGSGNNDEIIDQTIELMKLEDKTIDYPHKGNERISEVSYRIAWAKTYLKNYGLIDNSGKGVWLITDSSIDSKTLDPDLIYKKYRSGSNSGNGNGTGKIVEVQEDSEPWREELYNLLLNLNPYAFERLTKRVLRECGFSQVEVTKQSGDGGIDGYGKLRINGIFSFNIAFQCKRYRGTVGAPEIRDFRGSLTTDIEKGVFITTGTFTNAAKEEAIAPGKQQIDLMDGEDFIDKLIEYRIGVVEERVYRVLNNYFENI